MLWLWASLPQHEEPVFGEDGQERRQAIVEQVEPGEERWRVAEPCGERARGVPRNDAGAAAFDDREVGQQEPLDVGPCEEPAVLVDGMAKPGVDLPHEEFDPRGTLGQMADEPRAASAKIASRLG